MIKKNAFPAFAFLKQNNYENQNQQAENNNSKYLTRAQTSGLN